MTQHGTLGDAAPQSAPQLSSAQKRADPWGQQCQRFGMQLNPRPLPLLLRHLLLGHPSSLFCHLPLSSHLLSQREALGGGAGADAVPQLCVRGLDAGYLGACQHPHGSACPRRQASKAAPRPPLHTLNEGQF